MTRRHMKCSVCGAAAGRWAQHWNRDTGWGICRDCVDWLKAKGYSDAEMKDLYGEPGVHYAPPPHDRAA